VQDSVDNHVWIHQELETGWDFFGKKNNTSRPKKDCVYARFQTLTKCRLSRNRDHTVRQTVPNGGSGDRELSPAADGSQLEGRYYQTGRLRAERLER